ncbi:MAG TPA: addiction module protein [Longimicrobiaceae bacterium]|nr:addiction module protein [Longimicrobiaceae bacterium]
MGLSVEDIEAQAMELSREDRAYLAQRLIESLDDIDDDDDPEEVERAWSEEIQRRIDEIDSGAAELVAGDEVLGAFRARRSRQRDCGPPASAG